MLQFEVYTMASICREVVVGVGVVFVKWTRGRFCDVRRVCEVIRATKSGRNVVTFEIRKQGGKV